NAFELFKYNEQEAEQLRKMRFGRALTHQKHGIHRGTSALLALHTDEDEWTILPKASAQYYFLNGKSKQTYHTSLMGIIALIRQLHYDAKWYAENPEERDFDATLVAVNNQKSLPKIIEVGSQLSTLRADLLGDTLGFQFIIKTTGDDYKRLNELKNTKAPLIVPVNYPKPYDVSDPYDALQLSLAKMKEWEKADENLVHLQNEEITFSISADKIENEKSFFENIGRSIKKGLSHDRAIRALTLTPAELLGVDSILGSLEKGKFANFIISSDTLFNEKTILYSNWVKGKEFEINPSDLIDIRGLYSLNIHGVRQFDLKVRGE